MISLMPDPEVTKPAVAAEKGLPCYANASVCGGLAGRCFVGTPTESIWLAVKRLAPRASRVILDRRSQGHNGITPTQAV